MKWLKHDSDAHMDAKIMRLRMSHGMEAYGLYWHCLELIAGSVSADNLTFELEHDSELIAFQTGMPRDRVEAIMRDMVRLGLFESSEGRVTCLKLMKRIDTSQSGNPKFRKALINCKESHEAVMTGSGDSHDSVSKVSAQKIEDRTEDRREEEKPAPNRRSKFIPPTLEQVTEYVREKGYSFDPELFIGHYESQGWKKSNGRKVESWKGCCVTFQKNHEKFGGGSVQTSQEFTL